MGQQTSRIRRNNGSSSTTQTQTLKHGPKIQTQTLVDHPYQSPNTTTTDNNDNDNFNYNYDSNSAPWPLAPGPPPYSYSCSSAIGTTTSTTTGLQSPPSAHRSAISAASRGGTKERPKRRMRLLQDPLHPFLQQYELVFVVDDSTSMLSERWTEAEDVLAGVAQRCALHGPEENNGIDLYFLNHRSRSTTENSGHATGISGAANEEGYEVLDRPAAQGEEGGYTNIKTAEEVREIFGRVQPRGLTPFGNRVAQILDPYVRRVEDMMIARLSAGRGVYANHDHQHHHHHHYRYYYMDEKERKQNDVKPLYMIAITDGAFTDDAEKVLVEAARRLEGCRAAVGQVRVQFFQLGNDQRARQFLQVLEGGLTKQLVGEGGMMPRKTSSTIMVDMELGKGRLSADRILKSVLRAEKEHGHGP